MVGRLRHVPRTGSPHGPCVGTRRTPLCARCAQRACVCSLGGPEVRQALERPPMPAHARGGHPVPVGARTGHEPGGAALRNTLWHVRVPAPVIDQLVPLPGLIRQRPCQERLLDHRTLPGGQVPSSLPLPRSIGGLLGSRRGIVRPHRHPVPATPGGFPLDTGCIEAWSSHPEVLSMYAPHLGVGNIVLRCQGGVSIPGGTGGVHAPCATLRQDYGVRCGTLYHVRAAGHCQLHAKNCTSVQ